MGNAKNSHRNIVGNFAKTLGINALVFAIGWRRSILLRPPPYMTLYPFIAGF